jgi:nicotinic acid mononucleotide adenylyltransferase
MNDQIAIMWGRLNPPTWGHGMSITAMKYFAAQYNCDHRVILTRKHAWQSDPLKPERKLEVCRKAFPDTNIVLADEKDPTLFGELARLNQEGYKYLIFTCGEDRLAHFEKIIPEYNGKDYKFDRIQVLKTGARIIGVSGSVLRKACRENNYPGFIRYLPAPVAQDVCFSTQLFHECKYELQRPTEDKR